MTLYDQEAPDEAPNTLPAWDFVGMQRARQITTYGADPAELRGEERARYLRDMTLACTEELHEVLRENSWKPWHRGRPGYGEPSRALPPSAQRRAIEDEFGDVLIFVANLALAHGLTTQDLLAGVSRKILENGIRHADQASLEA